ncbi:hypothetical protein JB92DRAFT_3123347 [Gautieria morchelliformis]|nr:hypothetical protein JB92DRAFT_3123347 [Gautieria morchelliformis]
MLLLLIDSDFTHAEMLTMHSLTPPAPVYNVDGTPNGGGAIHGVVNIILQFGDHPGQLSEVFPVDFTTHKLHVYPTAILPKKVQKPVTVTQKEWYDSILTDMGHADIIQRVPAEFITKCLSSTNLAPKMAGKMGMTREAVLSLLPYLM